MIDFVSIVISLAARIYGKRSQESRRIKRLIGGVARNGGDD